MGTTALLALVAAVVFFVHRAVQVQYHTMCRADLFRVVLFKESDACVHMAGLLQAVESTYHTAVRHLAAQALGALTAGRLTDGEWWAAAVGVAGAAAGGGGMKGGVVAATTQAVVGIIRTAVAAAA